MSESPFEIIFDELAEGKSADESARTLAAESKSLSAELDEIAQLREMIAAITEPEPTSFTTS